MKRLKLFLILVISFDALSDNKKFVFDICSYNNAQWYEKNLDSVMTQDYDPEKFRVIYTDDRSTDGTGQFVKKYIEENHYENRITLIQNKNRRRALANHYNAIHLCEDDEIILTLDGDDWCSDDQLLNKLNALYSHNDIWFAYSRFVNWPKDVTKKTFAYEYSKPFPQRIIDQNGYRYFTWVCGQLRSFYAWLAKCIKLEDLILSEPLSMKHVSSPNFLGPVEKFSPARLGQGASVTNAFRGTFFPSACDVALMIPMLEMCGGRFKYIDEPIYIRNIATELNDHKVDPIMQNYCAFYVRTLKPYQKLEDLIRRRGSIKEQKAIVILLPSTTCDSIKSIYSVKNNMHGIQEIFFLGNEEQCAKARECDCLCVDLDHTADIKPILCEVLTRDCPYVIFIDQDKIPNNIDLGECIEQLEQTYAAAFYFAHDFGKNGVVEQLFHTDTYFWQYQYFTPEGSTVLYKNQQILERLKSFEEVKPADLSSFVTNIVQNRKSVGLIKII